MKSSTLALTLCLVACRTPPPAQNETAPATPLAVATTTPATAPPVLSTEDLLQREPVTETAEVLHVLIGWAELEDAYRGRMSETAKARSKMEADHLAAAILTRSRAGEDFKALMKAHSDDWASAENGTSYPVTADAQLVAPFKALSLRLEVGEAGQVMTKYGWHVIKRIG